MSERTFGVVAHSVSLLWRLYGDVERPVAALVLGPGAGAPAAPPSAALRVLAERLSRP
jgi:hypothetical protein